MKNTATACVPATSANIGPGYDSMGLALQLYNDVHVTRNEEGRGAVPADDMVTEASDLYFRRAKQKKFSFSWKITGDVPRSRGLGSSVTVRLGIIHALNALCGEPLDRDALFNVCTELEGHPDNAAPASYGGFTVAAVGMPLQRYAVSDALKIVLLIPEFEIETSEARRVLPSMIHHREATVNTAHAAAIAAAFASGDYAKLAGGFQDYLHQPYRAHLVPFLDKVIAAGKSAGALGGWLSGSGSAVACATLATPKKVAAAMLAVLNAKIPAKTVVVCADNEGVKVK